MVIELEFPVEPVPKARPRVGKKRTFTPKRTRDFERMIKDLAKLQMQVSPLDRCIGVEIKFYMTKPKKPSRPYPRGDIDNYCKSLLDGLNGVAFIDDAQICNLKASKHYSDEPLILVRLREL